MRERTARSIVIGIILLAVFATVWPRFVAADPPVDFSARANALSSAGNSDLEAGNAEKALGEFREAETLFRKAAGSADTADISNCLNDQAACMDQLKRYADALPLYKAALEIDQRIHKNQDDADVATAIGNVAGCLMNLDRWEEALPIYESSLKMERRLNDGKDSPDIAATSLAMATCLEHLGKKDLQAGNVDQAVLRFREAAEYFQKAAATRESADVCRCLNEQGICLHQLGHDEQALPIYQEVLQIEQKLTRNQDDADVAAVLDNVAECLMNLGRYEEALPLREAELKMKTNLANSQDDAEVANAGTGIGFCLNALGHYQDALSQFQSVLEMRKRIYKNQDQMDVVESLNNVAKCEDELGHSAQALRIYQSALEMTGRIYKNQDHADLALLMNNVAGCMESLGRGNDALTLFQDALAMRRRLSKSADDADIAASLNDLGTCFRLLGRDSEAIKNIQASYEMLQRIHHRVDSEDVATALSNVAECLQAMGHSAEALPQHQAALDMQRRLVKNQDHPLVAKSLINLSNCLELLGRHSDALAGEKDAVEMLQRIYKDSDHPDLAIALNNLATSLNNLNRFEEALPLYQQALEMNRRLYKNQNHPNLAVSLALVGGCLISLDRPAEALADLRDALAMQQAIYVGRDHPIIAWHLYKVGLCLSALGQKPEAIRVLQSAADMSSRLSDPELYRYSCRLGDCLLSSGKTTQAEIAYKTSIDSFEKARATLGGDDQDRMKFMDSAQDDCEPFVAMVRVQLQLNHPEMAAEYLDRSRARSLLDVLERAERQSGKDLLAPILIKAQQTHDSELLNQAKQAADALADADSLVEQLTSQINFARSLDNDQGRSQIDALQPKLDQACLQYAAAHRMAFNLAGTTTFTQTVSAAKMQSFLKPGQHLLMYSITDRDVTAILVPPAGQAISGISLVVPDHQTKLSGVALEQMIVDYQQAMLRHGQTSTRGVKLVHDDSTTRPSDEMTREGYELFRRLMPSAIWAQIKDDNLLYLVPDAGMNGLPLETLIVQSPKSQEAGKCQYFLDQGPAVCYGPSTAALIKLCEQKAGSIRKPFIHQAVLLGDPVLQRDAVPTIARSVDRTRNAGLGAYGPLSPLPGTRAEVIGIYNVLTGQPYAQQDDPSVVVLLGEDATSERLARSVAATRYLHLATHGLARSGKDAIYSSIVLTQPRAANSRDTGLLTLQELFDHWGGKLDGTELVVLSACDSQGIDPGKENAVTDEGVFGLPWGFWYAGCPTVVASLWEVQDDSTAKLMQSFYRQMQSASNQSKLKAFTAARKQLKQQYPEPFFWAPFIYLGNPN